MLNEGLEKKTTRWTQVPQRRSPLTKEALRETRASREQAKRKKRWYGLGCSASVVAKRLEEAEFVEVRRRALEQEEQVRMVNNLSLR